MTDLRLFIAAIIIVVVGGYGVVTNPYSKKKSDRIAWAALAALFVVVVAFIARIANGK